MIPADRHQQILALLDEQGAIAIADLSRRFRVSEMTIHRDLDRLVAAGQLRKVRGGAVPVVSGQALESPIPTTPDGCHVCHKRPQQRTQVSLQFADGRCQRACCPHCALMMLAHSAGPAPAMLVTGFLHGRTLTASSATFLVHPELIVCCTPTILAFEQREEARRFQTGFAGQIRDLAGALSYLQQAS